MKKIMFLLLGLILLVSNAGAQIKWPSITNETRPWTRWWWQGSAVNKKDLTWNLNQLNNAGLGGVEITPIYGVHGYEDQFIPFLSPKWMNMLDFTLAEAKRLHMGVDLANGTGWPFGGPWVSDYDASKTIYFKTYSVTGGNRLMEPITYVQEGWVRTANNKQVSTDSLFQPIGANKDLQSLALDQVVFPALLPLHILMAYSDTKKSMDLTLRVDESGKLQWTAPEGNWTLYALFMGLHGKMVERAAPGGEGYAIDHFSKTASRNYFQRFDSEFRGHDLSYIRSFFNDSYEVDDARGQSNWTPLLFEEFSNRRGYDVRENLPALFQQDDSVKNSRVLYDYRATIDELLLEDFTRQWKSWAATKGAKVRNQSHGSPANTLDLYSAVDIPETEGTDILRFKFATSAANVTGKKLVSAESATWLNEHFLSSWGDVKKAIDLFFLGGVNHIFYHGTAYSPQKAPWPGWLFYAAVHFQMTNPQWKDFRTLNEYIARVQSFLQLGKPANDILLYYPINDRYSEHGKTSLQHFDGMEKNFEGTAFEHLSKWMLEKGYGFDFFSERQLKDFKVQDQKIITGSNNFQAILLPANKYISEKSLQEIADLAKNGATIMVYKNLPQDVPGWGQLDSRRLELQRIISSLHFKDHGNIKIAVHGKGQFIMSDDINALLEAARIKNTMNTDAGLSVVKRKHNEGNTFFIVNQQDRVKQQWVTLHAHAKSVAVFDPMFGKSGLAKWRKGSEESIEVWLSLRPFESVVLQTFDVLKKGTSFPYVQVSDTSLAINGKWLVTFLDGGPVVPAKKYVNDLVSWTEWEGEDLQNFSGTARYSIDFNKPVGNAKNWLLNLGKVHETAEVFINGRKLATLVGPDFTVVIPSSLFKPVTRLEVIVANLMANRIAYMDKNKLPWKIFYNTNMPARLKENSKNGLFDASEWKPQKSGIIGPVTITPLKNPTP